MEGWPTGEIFMLCPRRNVLYKHILKKKRFRGFNFGFIGFPATIHFRVVFLVTCAA